MICETVFTIRMYNLSKPCWTPAPVASLQDQNKLQHSQESCALAKKDRNIPHAAHKTDRVRRIPVDLDKAVVGANKCGARMGNTSVCILYGSVHSRYASPLPTQGRNGQVENETPHFEEGCILNKECDM